MHLLQTTDLRDLLKTQTFPCISIYLNMGETLTERHNAKLRLKSFLKTANDVLGQNDLPDSQSFLLKPLVSQINDLVHKPISTAQSLAFFRSYKTAGVYPIHQTVADSLVINDSFHLKPLLPSLQHQDIYYTVVLNYRHIRLYSGRKNHFDLLRSFSLSPDGNMEKTDTGEWLVGPKKRIAGQKEIPFYSTGPSEDFVRKSEEEISGLIEEASAPLILVGSPLMRHFYRHSNRHPGLLKEEVSATFGVHESEDIRKSTWPFIEREFAKRTNSHSSFFKKMQSGSGASDNLEEIVKGVVQGRVSKLLISKNDKIFGRLERSCGTIIPLNSDQNPVGDDVLCDIAQIVLLAGGSAYVLPKNEMPTASPLAALYRW